MTTELLNSAGKNNTVERYYCMLAKEKKKKDDKYSYLLFVLDLKAATLFARHLWLCFLVEAYL